MLLYILLSFVLIHYVTLYNSLYDGFSIGGILHYSTVLCVLYPLPFTKSIHNFKHLQSKFNEAIICKSGNMHS